MKILNQWDLMALMEDHGFHCWYGHDLTSTREYLVVGEMLVDAWNQLSQGNEIMWSCDFWNDLMLLDVMWFFWSSKMNFVHLKLQNMVLWLINQPPQRNPPSEIMV